MMKVMVMHDPTQGREIMRRLWAWCEPQLQAGVKLVLKVREETRTLEQNAVQWPILEAFAAQLRWPVNGEMVQMDAEEWKDVLTAAFHGDTVRLAAGLNGGVVMLGRRTSKMPKQEFSAWLDFLHATAAMRGVMLQGPDVGGEPETTARANL